MKLENYQRELLSEGNCWVFAKIFCEKYPKVAEENNFQPNYYRSWVEFNEDLFTVFKRNGDKDFFNTNMEFVGRKEY